MKAYPPNSFVFSKAFVAIVLLVLFAFANHSKTDPCPANPPAITSVSVNQSDSTRATENVKKNNEEGAAFLKVLRSPVRSLLYFTVRSH